MSKQRQSVKECRIAKDCQRPFGHIWTKDQGGARPLSYWCSESDRYARGSGPLLYGVGHEHCQTPEVHPCRNGPQSSMEQGRELRRAGRGKVYGDHLGCHTQKQR